jgi:hypothetical protein
MQCTVLSSADSVYVLGPMDSTDGGPGFRHANAVFAEFSCLKVRLNKKDSQLTENTLHLPQRSANSAQGNNHSSLQSRAPAPRTVTASQSVLPHTAPTAFGVAIRSYSATPNMGCCRVSVP